MLQGSFLSSSSDYQTIPGALQRNAGPLTAPGPGNKPLYIRTGVHVSFETPPLFDRFN